MLDTKLILIEGLPGAGKSSSAVHLGTVLNQQGIPCRYFREEDDPHPLPVLDLAIKGLPEKMISLWGNFIQQTLGDSVITILESRLWQNTSLYMYMSEVDLEEIMRFHTQIGPVLTPLAPVLIYLDQEDTESALRRMYADRGEEWMRSTLEETTQYPWFRSRGITDFNGWVKFFEAWHPVAEKLYDLWPHRKLKIIDAHDDWARAHEQIYSFLQVDNKS